MRLGLRSLRWPLLVLALCGPASAETLLENGSFEEGKEPWRGRGETKESSSAPEGEQVLEVEDLTNSWQGPRQHFPERLQSGFEYRGSFWLRPLEKAERARLGLLYRDDNGWHMAVLASVDHPAKRRWLRVQGETVVLSWKGRLRDAKLQVVVDGDDEDEPPDYQIDAVELTRGSSLEELEDRFEDNDSLDAASDLGTLRGVLQASELYIHNATYKSGPAGDRDVFRFSLEKESPLSIRLRSHSGTSDLGVSLYSEAGKLLARSAISALSDERILYSGEPGAYLVSIEASGAHSFERYELVIHTEDDRESIPIVINGSFEESTTVWKTPGEAAEGSAFEGIYRLVVPASDRWAGARQYLESRVLPEASYTGSFFLRTRSVVSRARLLLMCHDSSGWQSSTLATLDSPQPRTWNEVLPQDASSFPCAQDFDSPQIALVVDPLRRTEPTPAYEVDHVQVVACLGDDCPPPSGRCGDGEVQEHERCDDGNTLDGDRCSADCQDLSCGPDGAACDDFNACTLGDTCQAGVCQPSQQVDCSGLDSSCEVGVCDPTSGSCSLQPAADGTACSDDNLCTATDQCLSGQCLGAAIDCSQGADSCHLGVCDPTTGTCSLETLPDGSSCDDGSSCTELDLCTGGLCVGSAVSCDDGDPCTADSCSPSGECLHEPGHCDGGDNATIRISLAGAQVAFHDGSKTHWLHTDAQGSVGAETDSSGSLVRRYLYSPFGAPHDPAPSKANPDTWASATMTPSFTSTPEPTTPQSEPSSKSTPSPTTGSGASGSTATPTPIRTPPLSPTPPVPVPDATTSSSSSMPTPFSPSPPPFTSSTTTVRTSSSRTRIPRSGIGPKRLPWSASAASGSPRWWSPRPRSSSRKPPTSMSTPRRSRSSPPRPPASWPRLRTATSPVTAPSKTCTPAPPSEPWESSRKAFPGWEGPPRRFWESRATRISLTAAAVN